MMFSNRDLRNLIFPLFVEQFLLMLVGIADTFTVSFASEADVSGVSLVNSFNTVLVFVFTALSSGGAVIISQYVGRGDGRRAERSAGQLLMISVLISAALTALILAFHSQLLILLFGRVEAQVMAASRSYLLITTCSIPALAVYDVGAALCRSIGKAGATMYISTAANLVNIIGNCVGVFVLHLGAEGVAWPSLFSRILSAAAVTVYCARQGNAVRYRFPDIFSWDGSLLKKIMGSAKWSRKRSAPTGEGGPVQHGGPVWHLSDRGQRPGPEHLVPGVHHGAGHGTGLYYRHRPVHGCWGD